MVINKKFLGSVLSNIIGWLMSMDSKDKDFCILAVSWVLQVFFIFLAWFK